MATIREIARIIALRTGEPLERVQGIADSLKAAGEWNTPSQAIASLLLALAAGAAPESAGSVARHYGALVDEGGKPVGEQIEGMLDTFIEQARTPYSKWAFQSWINVYRTVPAVCICTPADEGPPVERPYLEDHDPDTWRTTPVQEFTTIGGKLLFDIAADINLAAASLNV